MNQLGRIGSAICATVAMMFAVASQAQEPSQTDAAARVAEMNRQAMSVYGRGDYADAVTLAEKAHKEASEYLGAKHPDTLTSINNLAGLYQAQGRYDEAELLFLEALEGYSLVLGDENVHTLIAINNLALLYESQGRYGEAEPLYLEALEKRRGVLGDEHPDTIHSIGSLASLYQSQGRYSEAEPLYLEALEASRRVLGDEKPVTLLMINNLATLYQVQGRYEKAEPLYLEALETRRRVLGKDHLDTIASLTTLVSLYIELGRYREAEPLSIEALQASRRVLGEDDLWTLRALGNLAFLYEAQGRYGEAEPLHVSTLEASRHVLGNDHPETLHSLNGLAVHYHFRGRYGEAEPLLLSVLEARQRVLGKDHRETLTSINNLASLYFAQGRYKEAEPLFVSALEASRRILGADHPDTLTALNNLAALYQDEERYAEAEPLLISALEASRRVRGEDHPNTLSLRNNLATLYVDQGRYGEAEPLYLSTLEAGRRVLGKDHPQTLDSLSNLAGLYQAQGRYGEAETLLISALEAGQRVLGAKHINLAAYLSNYADLLVQSAQNLPLAIHYKKQAVNILQGVRANMSELEDATQAAFLEKNAKNYETLQAWLIEAGRFAEAEQVGRMLKEQEYFDFIRRRSDGVDDPRRSWITQTAQEQAWQERLDAMTGRVNAVAIERAALRDRQRAGAELTTLELRQLEDLDAAYDVAYASYVDEMRSFKAEVASLADEVVQAEARALETGLQRRFQDEVEAIGGNVGALQIVALEDSLHAFLVTPNAFRHIEAEVSRSDLYDAIFNVRDRLNSSAVGRARRLPGADGSASEAELVAALQTLHDMILPEELRQELADAGTETLMLNLQGPLRYVPFAALNDGDAYLTERYTLALFTPAARTRYEAGGALSLAAGFGVSEEHEGFSPLPAVKRELESLLTGDARILSGNAYLDAAFTREAFENELRSTPPVVHIASHFALQPGDESNSYLLLGDGQRLSLADISYDPDLDFGGVELMTLSACATGLTSNDGTGAEIEGLGTLVQEKGADAVIATLWNVADETTATFMQRFYRGLASDGLNKAKALQAAQIEMIANPDTSHPYYWAPYILMGNWK